MGHDESLGYSKLVPDFDEPFVPKPIWLKFALKPGGEDQPVNRAAMPAEILVDVTTIIGGMRPPGRIIPKECFEPPQREDSAEYEASREEDSMSPQTIMDTLAVPSYTQGQSDGLENTTISLDAALQNNELFMEFLEYLNSVKAPPYLQFMMNVDALRQFAAMSLGIDSKNPSTIDEYFQKGPLSAGLIEQLKTIKHDAADVFSTHFSDNARYRIPLDPGMQQELQEWVMRSDRVDENDHYSGGPIGPNIYVPAYKWVANVLEEVYFPKFKSSEAFGRFMDRARFATLNFTVDDDRMSIYSHDSSAVPPSWIYGDQVSQERQQAMSVGGRSRTNSFDHLDDYKEYEMPDPSSDVKKIATEISISRQKLSLIEDQLEKHENSGGSSESASRSLKKEKKGLELHVKNLLAMLEEKSHGIDNHMDEMWLDLRNAAIKVRFTSQRATEGETVLSSLWSSTMGSVMTEPAFDIEVKVTSSMNDEEGPTQSLVTRSFSEFQKLHSLLKKQFPKIGKIPFPEMGLLSVDGIDESLQTYLQMLISDEFVRQSNVLREFVSLDGDFESEKSVAGQVMEAIVGKKVKDVLKSATSLISGPTMPTEERRSKFYETKERHTSFDIGQADTNTESLVVPVFHSAADLSIAGSPSRPRRESPVKNRGTSPQRSMDPVGKTISSDAESLKRIPSVELPPKKSRRKSLYQQDSGSSNATLINELSDVEIEMLVETFFAFVIETFDLREPNQWLRRKLLGVFKQLLKQAYGDALNKVVTESLNKAVSEDAILFYLSEARQALYPDGIFISRRPPPPIRSEDQKFATMVEARTVFLKYTPDFVQNMAGRYNAVCGMTRIFHALQHKELNKTLIFAIIDIVLKLIFSERALG